MGEIGYNEYRKAPRQAVSPVGFWLKENRHRAGWRFSLSLLDTDGYRMTKKVNGNDDWKHRYHLLSAKEVADRLPLFAAPRRRKVR